MPGRWYAGTIIGRRNSEGALEVLVIDCSFTDPRYSHQPVQIKFPGGTEDGHEEDVNVLGTQARELTEETGLRLKQGFRPRLVYSKMIVGHFKNFYFAWLHECEGEIRSNEMTDNGDKMSAPRWVVAQLLVPKIYPTHLAGLRAVISQFE